MRAYKELVFDEIVVEDTALYSLAEYDLLLGSYDRLAFHAKVMPIVKLSQQLSIEVYHGADGNTFQQMGTTSIEGASYNSGPDLIGQHVPSGVLQSRARLKVWLSSGDIARVKIWAVGRCKRAQFDRSLVKKGCGGGCGGDCGSSTRGGLPTPKGPTPLAPIIPTSNQITAYDIYCLNHPQQCNPPQKDPSGNALQHAIVSGSPKQPVPATPCDNAECMGADFVLANGCDQPLTNACGWADPHGSVGQMYAWVACRALRAYWNARAVMCQGWSSQVAMHDAANSQAHSDLLWATVASGYPSWDSCIQDLYNQLMSSDFLNWPSIIASHPCT